MPESARRQRRSNRAASNRAAQSPVTAAAPRSPLLAAGNRSVAKAITADSATGAVVRREIVTDWGAFSDTKYDPVEDDVKHGVDMVLEFMPGEEVDSPKVGMTQAILTQKEGKPYTFGETRGEKARMDQITITGDEGKGFEGLAGWRIDRTGDHPNPIYGADSPDPRGLNVGDYKPADNKDRTLEATSFATQKEGFSQLGRRVGKEDPVAARVADTPTLAKPLPANSRQEFETTALSIEGTQAGQYYGSVGWGWETDETGEFAKLPFSKLSDGPPTSRFAKSAEKWNLGDSKFTNPPFDFVKPKPMKGYTNIPLPEVQTD